MAAFVVFLTGAGFWLVKEFEQPLPAMLRAAHVRRRRWLWIHAWMVAGTLVSVLAVVSLVQLLTRDGNRWLATAGLLAFASGGVAFLASLAIRIIKSPAAAAEAYQSGVVPLAYESQHRLASRLYVASMLLSYATFALLGAAMLGSALFPAWLGWTGLVVGIVAVIGFPLLGGGPFAPPINAHAYGLLVGIVLQVK